MNEYLKNLKVGDTYHNNNGETYLVIAINEERDKVLLLGRGGNYIVAWGIQEGSWCQGHYFRTFFKNAIEYFYE